MRHLALLPFAALLAFLGGCTSDDAGSSLDVSLDGVGMVLGSESPSTDPKKPSLYEGKTTAIAKVQYKGKGALGYAWSVMLPGEVQGELSASDEELEITGKVLALPNSDPNIGSGVGTIRLTVYEKSGSQSRTVSSPIRIITSDGG